MSDETAASLKGGAYVDIHEAPKEPAKAPAKPTRVKASADDKD